MEAITSNVLHLGVIALEDEFQRGAGQRDGKKKKKRQQLFERDLQISGINFENLCVRLVLFNRNAL